MPTGNSQKGELVKFERHTYEDPFLDMASTRLPKSIRKLQELCQIFAMTHPQIAPIIWRLAEYPITSLVYTGEDEAQRQHKELFEGKLGFPDVQVEWGLDYFGYGNCFITVYFPFLRFYKCGACTGQFPAKDIKYKYDGRSFSGRCPDCKAERKFKPVDQYLRGSTDGIRVFRLEPQLITPKYNRVTGKTRYYYRVPYDLRMAVKAGDRDIIDETPVEYLQAIRLHKPIRLKRVFHFKRPTLSGRDMQWGLPLVLPALKDAYLNQIYKKADEQVALEHSVPLRILYPEPGSQDPLHKLLLGSFKNFMDRNVRYWRRDKNAILTSPLPVGVRVIGGDQANYSTINARVKVVDEIMMAMLVTPGFVRGGENWSSASISHRQMENSFLNYLRRMDACLKWVRDEIANFVDLPPCSITMKPFKKVDDVQMLQLLMQLAQMDKISWHEMLSRLDIEESEQLEQMLKTLPKHNNIMISKLIGQAEAAAKGAIANAVAEVDAQSASGVLQQMLEATQEAQGTSPEEAAPPQPGEEDRQGGEVVNMQGKVDEYAQQLMSLSPEEQQNFISQMNSQSPQLAKAVVDRATQIEDEGGMGDPAEQAMELMKQGANPEEVANKLSAIPPRQQLSVMKAMQKVNPSYFVRVMSEMARMNQQQAGMVSGGGKGGVDMRPLPDQKPPRRKESPV